MTSTEPSSNSIPTKTDESQAVAASSKTTQAEPEELPENPAALAEEFEGQTAEPESQAEEPEVQASESSLTEPGEDDEDDEDVYVSRAPKQTGIYDGKKVKK